MRGASDQIAELRAYLQAQPMDAPLQKRLLDALDAAAKAVDAERGSACQRLGSIVAMLNGADKKLTPAQVERILTDVARIQAVLGC